MPYIPVAVVSGAGSSLTKIEDQLLGSPAASFDFQNIPATFINLQIFLSARGDTAATSTTLNVRINNDSAAHYDRELQVAHSGTLATSETILGTEAIVGDVAANSATAGMVGSYLLTFFNYAQTTFFKNFTSSSGGFGRASSTNDVWLEAVFSEWISTAAINRVTLFPGAGSFLAGSRATLYGLA